MSITKVLTGIFILILMAGCANIHLKKGGVAVGKDTTVGIEGLGVATVTQGF